MIYQIQGIVKLLSSLSHIGETHGITSMLRRESFIIDGEIEQIPIYSGNAFRGILRDLGMIHMLKYLNFDEKGIDLNVFYFLLSGGTLTSTSNAIDIDKARKFRTLIPLVSVFGGAMGTEIMPGKLKVNKLYPLCSELKCFLPEFVQEKCKVSVWELIQQEAYTRKDDAKNVNYRYLLNYNTVKLLEDKEDEKQKKSENKESNDTKQKQQMRFFCETLIGGTELYTEFNIFDVNDIEFEAFLSCFIEFSKMPYLGGKSSIGHGKVELNLNNWLEISSQHKQGTEITKLIGTQYYDHLKNNRELIKEILNELP